MPVPCQFVAGREAGRSGPYDDDLALGLCLQNLSRSPLSILSSPIGAKCDARTK